jgi:hypothetical protein
MRCPHCQHEFEVEEPDDEQFEQFWQSFPKERRRGKGAVRKKFNRLIEKGEVTVPELIHAVRMCRGIDPSYPCMPATWLNQKRWLDPPFERKATMVDTMEDLLG